MDAVILFSHGSLLCGAGEALDAHARRLRAMAEWALVEIGYMNYSEPAFLDAVAKCHAAGATRIVVAPYFLVPGFFVTKGLPEHLAAARAAYPDIAFIVADAIGFHPNLADALIESAEAARGPDAWRSDLTTAARACRARSDCPLYGTADCPGVEGSS